MEYAVLSNPSGDPIDVSVDVRKSARERSQTEEAIQLGIFGAPSFITKDGELFWGNDRLERAIAWARTAR